MDNQHSALYRKQMPQGGPEQTLLNSLNHFAAAAQSHKPENVKNQSCRLAINSWDLAAKNALGPEYGPRVLTKHLKTIDSDGVLGGKVRRLRLEIIIVKTRRTMATFKAASLRS